MKKKKIRKHKRHFQLLELMVAAFILLICIAPVMRIFTMMYLSQHDIVSENQRDHLAHMAHAKSVEKLYKRQIILEKGSEIQSIPVDDSDLIAQLKKFGYELEVFLAPVAFHQKKGEEHPDKYLRQIVVKFKDVLNRSQCKTCENQDSSDPIYDFFVYIDAGYKEKDQGDEELAQESTSETSASSASTDEDEIADEEDFDDDDDFDSDDFDDDFDDFDEDDDDDEDLS